MHSRTLTVHIQGVKVANLVYKKEEIPRTYMTHSAHLLMRTTPLPALKPTVPDIYPLRAGSHHLLYTQLGPASCARLLVIPSSYKLLEVGIG